MSDDINIWIKATDQASPAFKSAAASAKGMMVTFSSLAAAAGGFLGAGAIAAFTKEAVGGMFEARKAAAQLNQVIKSTGGVAGVTASMVNKLADSMQSVTNFEDDVIVKASGVMLTFTKIGKDIFPEAIKAAADLSTMMGGDLQGAIVQVGKALNDPIKGITALSRVGVSFSSSQKDMIKSLIDTNQLLEAQKIILRELKTEMGGQAEAQSDPFTRAWNLTKDEAERIADSAEYLGPWNAKKHMEERYREILDKNTDNFWNGSFRAPVMSGLGGVLGNVAGNYTGNLGKMREEIGFRIMPKINQMVGGVLGKAKADAAMAGPGRSKILQALGGNQKGSDLMARAIFGQNDPFAGKPKEMDFFEHFRREALFAKIKLPDHDKHRESTAGNIGLASRFLSTGVGYDPSTQTAKNTAAAVAELKECKNALQAAVRALGRLDDKTPKTVARLGGAGAGGF